MNFLTQNLENPCEGAEERKPRWIRARDCLSAASASGTPAGLSTGGCPERSGGTQAVGSPFLLLTLLLAKQKKSESPAAATERHQVSSTNPTDRKKQGFGRLSRNGCEAPHEEQKRKLRCGRFEGQSTNSPSLRLALRVLRFAAQRNCDLTLKTIRPPIPSPNPTPKPL